MFIIVLLWLLIILIFLSIILYVPYNKVTLLQYNSNLALLQSTSGNYNLGINSELLDTPGYLQITLFLTSPKRMTFITGTEKIILKKGYNTFIVKAPCHTFQLTQNGIPTAGDITLKEVILYYK